MGKVVFFFFFFSTKDKLLWTFYLFTEIRCCIIYKIIIHSFRPVFSSLLSLSQHLAYILSGLYFSDEVLLLLYIDSFRPVSSSLLSLSQNLVNLPSGFHFSDEVLLLLYIDSLGPVSSSLAKYFDKDNLFVDLHFCWGEVLWELYNRPVSSFWLYSNFLDEALSLLLIFD